MRRKVARPATTARRPDSRLRDGVGLLHLSTLAGLLDLALVRARAGLVRFDRGAKLVPEALELLNRAIALGLELAHGRLDLRPPAFAFLDDLLRLRGGRLARPLGVFFGLRSHLLRVLIGRLPRLERRRLGVRAQLHALVVRQAAQLRRLLLGRQEYARGRLPDELELALDRQLPELLSRIRLEPVDQGPKEPVDLPSVVAAASHREARVTKAVDLFPVHSPVLPVVPARTA